MKYTPLYDNVVVKLSQQDEKTASGIIIPDASKEKPTKGEVIAVGEGRVLSSGSVQTPQVHVGDVVLFKGYAPTEIPGEEDLVIISESDILAIIK
jgi:chaperonin GroES